MMPVAGITKGPPNTGIRPIDGPDQFRPGITPQMPTPTALPRIQQPEASPPWDPRKPMPMYGAQPTFPTNTPLGVPPPVGPAPWTPTYNMPGQVAQQPTAPPVSRPTPMPQPAASPMPSLPSTGMGNYSGLTDPTPYNRAVDRGNQLIGSIPNNASPLTSFSPAFKGLSPNMSQALNSQWQNYGQGMRDEAGLEFARKAGSEVPAFQLAQQLGLRGLQNDWSDLDNLFYGNNISRTTGGMNSILQLLGAFGSFF